MNGRIAALLAAGALAGALPALAHHGVASYEMDVVRTLEGVVERWDFGSPHTFLTLAVEQAGERQIWDIEGAPPRWMTGQGWTPESLTRGEPVTIAFHPHRRTARAGILMTVTRANGDVLAVNRPASLGGP
jgi:hypothetical protein